MLNIHYNLGRRNVNFFSIICSSKQLLDCWENFGSEHMKILQARQVTMGLDWLKGYRMQFQLCSLKA